MRHIADAYRRAPARTDDDLAELLRRGDAPERAKPQFLRAGNHAPAWRFDVLALQSRTHVKDSKIVSGELLDIQQNSNLPGLAAVQIDAANSVHGLNDPTDLFVGDLGQFAAAHGAAHEESHDGIRLRILLGDDWRKSVARQAGNSSGNFFTDVLSRALDVALKHEGTSNVSKAFEGPYVDLINAAD